MLNKLEEIFKKNSSKVAYIVGNEEITYEELYIKAENLSEDLKKEGNSPVIIVGDKDIYVIIAIIACLMAKRAYVPVDNNIPQDRLNKIIEATKSTLIINGKDTSITKSNETIINNNEIAYIIFTSGSTGEPKGVPISYSNLNNFINWISNIEPLSLYRNIKVLNQASFSFDLSVADIYYALFNGHTLVGLKRKEQEEISDIFKVIEQNNIDLIITTPTFMKLCLLNKEFNSNNYNSLKCVYFCGETLEKETASKLLNAFSNLVIINAYGPTEATSAVASIIINKEFLNEGDSLPIGQISKAATQISIIDGEIVLKGSSVFNGYLNHKIIDNCYKTGDLGYIKEDNLYFIGRKDSQVKFKGYRIELLDIEANIKKINGVLDCVVIAKKNSKNIVKLIKAFVVLEDKFDVEYIKEQLKLLILPYMIPSIIKIDALPINKNSKIDRKKLEEL